jgi:hypothetical protein
VTDETPKPKRKRRRWLIAGALLVVLSIAGWWFWPHEDSRFVGKWAATGDGPTRPGSAYEFSSLGAGNFGPNSFLWNVEGDKLVFEAPSVQADSVFFTAYLILRQLTRALGAEPSPNRATSAIVQVEKDLFIINHETPGEPTERITFRRIRE